MGAEGLQGAVCIPRLTIRCFRDRGEREMGALTGRFRLGRGGIRLVRGASLGLGVEDRVVVGEVVGLEGDLGGLGVISFDGV